MKRLLLYVLAPLIAVLSSETVLAQTLPNVICGNLPGCGSGPTNVLFYSTLPTVVGLLIRLAAGGAVVAIVVAGTELLLKSSDEAATSAKKAIMYAFGGLGLAIAAAPIVGFVTTENYGQSNSGDLLFGNGGVLTSAVRIIMVLFDAGFVMVIIIAGIRMAMSSGNADEFKRGGTMIKWAIVGAVIVNLARALVQAFLRINL
jgi:hypothetical protein